MAQNTATLDDLAAAADVLTGKIIVDAAGKTVAGAMPNNGAFSGAVFLSDDIENALAEILRGAMSIQSEIGRIAGNVTDSFSAVGPKGGTIPEEQLDDFKANAPGRYNRFARDLDALGDFYDGRKNGYDWCDVFVDWCFVHAFGRELGQKLLGQPNRSLGAGTGYSLHYYRSNGRLFASPQPGDQIFFGDSSSTWHTGLVTKAEGGFVHTVEGNAGSPPAVRACRYAVGSKTIKGYGRPDWPLVPEKEEDDMVCYQTLDDVPGCYREPSPPVPDEAPENFRFS